MAINTLKFWQAIEALTPQEAARVNANDPTSPVYGIASGDDVSLPWHEGKRRPTQFDSGWQWQYAAQCGIYSIDALSRRLVSKLGTEQEQWSERTGGVSRLFDLSFDHNGYPIPHTFTLSMAAWAGGQILRDGGGVNVLLAGGHCDRSGLPVPDHAMPEISSGYSAFDGISMALMQWVVDESVRRLDACKPADAKWIHQLIALVLDTVSLPREVLNEGSHIRVRVAKIKAANAQDKTNTPDILTSFFAEDLKRVESAYLAGKTGKGFQQYMSSGGGKHKVERIDVREAESGQAISDALRPDRMPMGRWPSDHALVFSQQLAVNEAWSNLSDGAGLIAVNGPPGTGKTTLLRDVVAAVVTQRAAHLVKNRLSKFGAKQVCKLGDISVPYYPLHECLQGHSIVVASTNNGAVENISLELPGLGAVPERVSSAPRYYHELAEKVSGRESWALMSAALGNRQNRADFLSKFWWGDRPSSQPNADKPSGLRDRLKSIQQGNCKPAIAWEDAVKRFKDAVQREQKIRDSLDAQSKLPEHIAHITLRVQRDESARDSLLRILAERESMLMQADAQIEGAIVHEQAALAKVEASQRLESEHQNSKPGFLTWISTFGRAQREWWFQSQEINRDLKVFRRAHESAASTSEAYRAARVSRAALVDDALTKIDTLDTQMQAALVNLRTYQSMLNASMAQLGANWPDVEAEPDDRERIEPWGTKEWLQAREDVFLAALDVHRAFAEAHPVQMIANLGLASDWLSGKQMSPELARLALDSLCLVVPVISTTFASVPRMFSSITNEAIGYLLIDESGQAIPSHAACAIWRARRTLVVGDPRQLEPVFSMPPAMEAKLGSVFGVGRQWWPGHTSAQALADQSSRFGTWLPEQSGEKTWVGCPLRLHRRCDEPMFSISNHIAYGGMMVYGKNTSDTSSLPSSAWIDVKSESGEGHWVPAEGVQLMGLVDGLLEAGVGRDQIALISPFRDCASRLRRIALDMGLDAGKAGTVHTAQGKEADVVVLMLGGNPRLPGAKVWAASKPNLLNVAVSRGKKRLYVIGDLAAWRKHNHFSLMADYLPEREAVAFSN